MKNYQFNKPMFQEGYVTPQDYINEGIIPIEPKENYRVSLAKENFTTHGKRYTRRYNIWTCMKARCNRETHTQYKDYGGRGIKVCKEWEEDFMSFYKWSEENGYSEDLTLDRIDNDGGYEPSNCRWSTAKEQNNNSRNCNFITYKGETKNLTEWGEKLNIPMSTLSARLKRGWTVEKTLTTPVIKTGRWE